MSTKVTKRKTGEKNQVNEKRSRHNLQVTLSLSKKFKHDNIVNYINRLKKRYLICCRYYRSMQFLKKLVYKGVLVLLTVEISKRISNYDMICYNRRILLDRNNSTVIVRPSSTFRATFDLTKHQNLSDV